MDNKVLFLQKAVSLNYLKQNELIALLKKYSGSLPDDMETILVNSQLLTIEQIRIVQQELGTSKQEKVESTFDQTISEDQVSEGESISDGYIISGASDSLVIEDSSPEEGVHMDLGMSFSEEDSSNIIDFEKDNKGQPLNVTMLESSNATNPNSEDDDDLFTTKHEKSTNNDFLFEKDSVISGQTIQYGNVDASESTLDYSIGESGIDDSSQHTVLFSGATNIDENLPKPGTPEDMALAQKAIEKKKISVSDLQKCIQERQSLSQSGHNISICRLLIDRNILSEEEIFSLLNEKKTEAANKTPVKKDEFETGQILIGKYRVVERLGSGGMGAVYKVEHIMLQHNKYFALKIMHPYIAANENNYKRFVREVEATMSVMHRNIIPIREFGILENHSPYLTMDCSTGAPLDSILKKDWNKDISRSVLIVRQILDGLSEAHKRNIIHRDLKPANILVEDDQDEKDKDLVKIVDFGLAKLVEESENMESITHGTIGTPFYMSPQQAGGEKVDHRTDIYAVGVILYEMITGSLPFHSNTLRELLKQQMFELPKSPREARPDLPKNLELIILKALAKKVEDRYQNTTEFIHDLDLFLDGKKAVTAKKIRSSSTWKTPAFVALIFLAVAITIGVLYYPKMVSSTVGEFSVFEQKIQECVNKELWYEARVLINQAENVAINEQDVNKIVRLRNLVNENIQKMSGSNRFQLIESKMKAYISQQLWEEAKLLLPEASTLAYTQEEITIITEYQVLLDKRIHEKNDYLKTQSSVKFAQEQKNFSKAMSLLNVYLQTYPESIYTTVIGEQLDSLKKTSLQEEQHVELQNKINYDRAKAQVTSLIDQKLWQAAYNSVLELEKLNPSEDEQKQEIQNIKSKVLHRLNEVREYQETVERAQIYENQKKYNQALELWRSYTQKYPDSDKNALIQDRIGNLQHFNEDAQQKEVWNVIKEGENAYREENYDKAIKMLEPLLEKNSQNKELLLVLGKSYYHKKNLSKSLKYLLQSKDESAETFYQIATLYRAKRSYSKSIFYMEKSVALWKNSGDDDKFIASATTLAQLYEKQNNTDKAISSYKQTLRQIEKLRLQKKYVTLFRHVGILLYNSGAKEESKVYLNTFRSLGGNDDEVSKILLQLTNYTPLSFRKEWKFRITVNNNNTYTEYQIAAINNDQYLLKVDGKMGNEKWYVEGDYLIKEFNIGTKDKVFKYPVSLGEKWISEVANYKIEYRVVGISENILVPAGSFENCIKLELNYLNNPGRKSYVYYAPEIGEIKQEKTNNGQVIFLKELIEYNN